MPEGLKGTEKLALSFQGQGRETQAWPVVPPRSDSASKNTKAGAGTLETTAGNK